MKKLYFLLSTTAALLSISFSAYAGQWHQEGEHWKYLNNDGTYSAHTWQWIDGNGDGISESYYFDDNGFLYLDTITPDGYSVNQDGAWVVNGEVQTKSETSGEGEYISLEVGYNAKIPVGMERVHNNILDYYKRTSARFEDAQGTRLISFSIDDYRNQAEYFRTVEGTTDASFQERKADAVGTTLKATVVLRDTKEYHSGTWSHVQLTDYVGDYQKHWSNVHYFFQSNDFVLTTVRIWSTGADMDVDGFMNSLVKNSYYDSVR